MNTEKVFIMFSKEGEELLLYKKDNNTYINLLNNNNEIYPIENIDTSIIIPYRKAINTFKHVPDIILVNKYIKDRSKILDASKIKLGYVCVATNKEKEYTLPFQINYSWLAKECFKSLFIEDNNNNNKYLDILENKKYYNENSKKFINIALVKGKPYASVEYGNIISNKINENGSTYMEKKKIMELAYKARKNMI